MIGEKEEAEIATTTTKTYNAHKLLLCESGEIYSSMVRLFLDISCKGIRTH